MRCNVLGMPLPDPAETAGNNSICQLLLDQTWILYEKIVDSISKQSARQDFSYRALIFYGELIYLLWIVVSPLAPERNHLFPSIFFFTSPQLLFPTIPVRASSSSNTLKPKESVGLSVYQIPRHAQREYQGKVGHSTRLCHAPLSPPRITTVFPGQGRLGPTGSISC